MSLSVVINTKNMAGFLRNALESIKDLADEIVIVDMSSSDDTVKVASEYTDKIFQYGKDLLFADPARNFALGKASGDWIFVIDADEEVGVALKSLIKLISSGHAKQDMDGDCYFIPRRNIIFGKKMQKTGWWPDYQMRLFKKGHAEWTDKVHTAPITQGKVIHLPPQDEFAIIHHNYQNVSQFIERLNRYTTVQSDDKKVANPEVIKAFGDEFFRRFFAQGGVEEGTHGLSLSFLQAMYEAVVVLKEWEKGGFSEGNCEALPQLQLFHRQLGYWLADWHVQHSQGIPRLIWQLRRKWCS